MCIVSSTCNHGAMPQSLTMLFVNNFLLKIKSIEIKLYTNILNFLISLKEFLLEKYIINNPKMKCFLKFFNCQSDKIK
jgi:hypothetical protein